MSRPTSINAPGAYTTCDPYHMFYDDDDKCGPDNHYRCPKKKCCGKNGKCGTGEDYCGAGCQLGWSDCWNSSTTCKVLNQDKDKDKDDDDDDHLIPIFPLWHERPDPPGPPPTINIEFGEIRFPKPPTIDWIKIIGGDFDCGWLGCDGITGWFLKLIPIRIKPCNPITKMLCRLLRLNCCPKKDKNNDKDKDCVGCDPPPSITGLFGDSKICDEPMDKCEDLEPENDEGDEDCTSTSTAVDKTVFCEVMTATNGGASETCTSTASETRSGCTLAPATTTTVTSTACGTVTASQISEYCTVITAGSSTVTTACPSTITNKVTGCDATAESTSIRRHRSQHDDNLLSADSNL
ncbi:hypothetical protein CLAFUW4_01726 [Fulvia fulva]|uniref:Chitin-binding type-1 domain-containing protein n=1 Tax=Passalora fulva TaxID=5499 RepID=A0A9Q8P2J2_PASFU|nr:uncharacterized protein CLAFUR5_01722 [Fulvia fulva]KAK4635018.1 hypothetical protein CLAFUR4_01724 [Fulvia fulva]KAK4636563.1 hypothetical protein CLAFUR0_01725 [Fulvia fulva]UJO10978.1 hypothetical protein CLAFUR5_01722 [Fulvia fulva]WPV08601.1 hypothetical protein CLAFUW4_01726 [Fulvia fulva]WPV24432.1 hypothetical protein CLAFUW7_01728 [Fulvia fulva]